MEIIDGIEMVDLALFIKKPKILVISDLQLGYEENLNKSGILIPRTQSDDSIKRIGRLIEKTKPSKIILNGDIKHEFGRISESEWSQVLRVVRFCQEKSELVMLKGNHDNMLMPIAAKQKLLLLEYFEKENIYICHGHLIPDDKDYARAKIVIIGHEHPAITLVEGARREKYKCFLLGSYKNKALIVLPSFNNLTEGSDVLTEKILSPFLQQRLGNFEAFVIADEVMPFGKLKALAHL
ncbi:MAG: metallophosphoesterase [archaeon]